MDPAASYFCSILDRDLSVRSLEKYEARAQVRLAAAMEWSTSRKQLFGFVRFGILSEAESIDLQHGRTAAIGQDRNAVKALLFLDCRRRNTGNPIEILGVSQFSERALIETAWSTLSR